MFTMPRMTVNANARSRMVRSISVIPLKLVWHSMQDIPGLARRRTKLEPASAGASPEHAESYSFDRRANPP